jgi:hypothetical protein
MRKRKLHYCDLGSIPVTEVPNRSGWQSKAEFLASEKEAAERPVKEAIASLESTYGQLRTLASQFWSRPVRELQLSIYQDSARDVTFNAPPAEKIFTREDLIAACDRWHDEFFVNTGYELNPDGVMRLCCFGESQARAGADMSQPLAWGLAFAHLRDNLHAFGDELDSSRAPHAEPPAPPQPTLSDLEKFAKPLDSTDGRLEALKIVEELASTEAAGMLSQWLQHLKDVWKFTPTISQNRAVLAWFRRNATESWLNPESYNRCRRSLSAQGVWDLLTIDEREAQAIEQSTTPLAKMGFYDKRDLKTRIARLSEPA